ncbi:MULTISPECIES: RICH domain-containing protein [unclassified Streptococcus]|uniref:RICH domain-containing protein n=1 Tax=unclassified Streptococcus TaxID=2608887 RepID=UPI0015673F83|nr:MULTISPECIES: RICH domain-containing protein [unclassified Streptococcus]
MFASKSERKVRYSIRKFSIGVASVVVASLFLGGVVHAEGVGGGNNPMVTSSGEDRLKEYKQLLLKELEETALPEDKKAEYRKRIEQEMDYSVLAEIENNFHQESLEIRNKEHDEVVEKAKTEFPRYLDQILTGLEKLVDEKDSQFEKLIQEAKDIVEEYKRRFDKGIDSQDIKRLEQEGKNKIDKLVEDFKNSLSNQQSEPSGNSNSSNGRGDTTKPANQGLDSDSPSGKEHNKPTPPKVENQGGNIVSTEKTTETNLKEAKETAKTTLDNYRKNRLTKLNPAAFWFGELLLASQKTLSEYSTQFESASSKEELKALIEKSKQAIDELIATHQNREISLERNKAKEAVTKHLAKLLDDIKKNLEKEQHINTVELIKNLKDIEKTYLHKLDESTQKAQLQNLVTESQSKLDEALSNFKKGLSSSSNSGSSTKPETPEKSEQPTPSKPAEKEQNPSGSTTGSHSGSASSSGSSSAPTKPKSPEKPERPAPSKPAEKEQNPSGSATGRQSDSTSSSGSSSASTKPETPEKSEQPTPSKPAEKEQNPSGSTTGSHSGSTSSSGSSSASTKPKSPEKPGEPTPSKPSGNETNSSSPTRSNSLSPTLSSQPTSTVQKVFTTQNGNTKITVMFETATEADSVNLKEVTTKEMIDNVTRQTGQGTVRIFDISLSKDGKETHVKGERVVRLAIGNIDSEIQVYHVKENGELELLPSTVENGQVVFKTSHFSLFAIKTLPKKQMATEPEANREGKTQSDDKEMVLLADKANQMSENRSNSDKKDKQALPSTGTMSTLLMEFLGLISLVGVYLLKGKKTEND